MSSSRRTSGEINILAMLDGQSIKPRRFSGLSRVAWIGASGVLACALLGTAAWMVHEQSGGGFENRVPAGPAVVPLEIATETVPNPALRIDARPAQGAAIVDLPAHAGAGEPARAHADALALDEAHGAAQAVAVAVATPAAALPAVAPAAAKPSVHAAPRVNKAAARMAGTPARPAAPAHARHPAATPKPKPAPATVDTDVALISAIIQHVNQHGELKDGKECSDKPCLPKMTNRP